MSQPSTISLRKAASHLTLAAMTALVIISTMLSGCKKNKTESNNPPLGNDPTLRFVFLADSRGDTMTHPVDTTALNPIIRAIAKLSPKPSFVMFGGDMSYRGCIDNVFTFEAFKSLFTPVIDSGIPLYTTVGNHELYHQHASYGYFLVNQVAFQAAFAGNPTNGPAGYEHLTYSLIDPVTGSLFVVLDPYYVTKDTMHLAMGGTIDPTQMSWLRQVVATNSGALHKFLFIHCPYYYVADDPEEHSSADTTYTKLWAFIDSAKFDIYACGHTHLFSQRSIIDTVHPYPQTSPPTPGWQNNVIQLVNGTCGAGPSTVSINPNMRALWDIHNDPLTYYFSVIEVTGRTTTVISYKGYTGAYTPFDTIAITR